MNEDAVIQLAKKKLGKCRSLMRRAGMRASDLKSPSFDDQPKSVSYENSVEKALVRKLDADNELRYIMAAINLCEEPYKKILFDLYVGAEDSSNIEVMINGHHTERTFYRLERRALYQFAEGYKYGELFELGSEVAE